MYIYEELAKTLKWLGKSKRPQLLIGMLVHLFGFNDWSNFKSQN